jgi:uncharacterized protein
MPERAPRFPLLLRHPSARTKNSTAGYHQHRHEDPIMTPGRVGSSGSGRSIIGFQEYSDFWLGAGVTFLAALLGGGAGFGYALLAAPFLLMIGFSPPFVVTVNLTLGLLTRATVAYKFRYYITPRRIGVLMAASVPGMIAGILALTRLEADVIRMGTGIFVIIAAAGLAWSTTRPEKGRPIPAGTALAGLLGGFLGTTTSLSGVPAAIYFIRERLEPIRFLADMAAFFICANFVALTLMIVSGAFVTSAIFPAALLWLPGAIVGNLVGATIGSRLPPGIFRRFALGVVFVAGVITVLTT